MATPGWVGDSGFSLRKKYRVFPSRKLVQCSNFSVWSFAAWTFRKYCVAARPQHAASRPAPVFYKADAWIQRAAACVGGALCRRRLVACSSAAMRAAALALQRLRQELERVRRADGRNGRRTRLSECALTYASGRAAREPRAFRRAWLPPVRRVPALRAPPEPGG